jgi:hypothetical protein
LTYPTPPPAQPPAPPPGRTRRPLWQWGCGALILLLVCGVIATVAAPKTPSSPAAVTVPTTAPTTAPAAAAPTAAAAAPTQVPAQATEVPTVVPSPTVDFAATLSATSTALAGLPPNVRYAPPGCKTGVQYGSLCKDGSFSTTTGQGACSGHKGVQQKLMCP